MYEQKRDSMIKNALTSLCCSNGWCYGIFWGFDLRNSLLLTFKEGYYEEQMGAIIDSMLLQAHVLGGGVIGQAAFMKNQRWMYSDERQNSFDSVELFQEDSEFFWQFSMGIKTIAVISVEPWGVVQLGSTHKNPETESLVDEVKQVFREMDKSSEIKTMENEAYTDSQVFVSNTHLNFEGFMEANHSSVLPCISDNHTTNFIFPTTENSIQIEGTNLFDFSSSWPHLESFFNPIDYESWSLDAPLNLDDDNEFSRCFSPSSGKNNLPTTSLQSSVTDAFRTCNDVNDCEMDKVLDAFGDERGRIDALNFTRDERVRSTSNSLFSQLGIDHLLDAIPSTSSCSSAAKRRKVDNFSRSNIDLDCQELTKEAHSCVEHGVNIASRWQEKQVKSKKKKAKPGMKPRPKDRQMIQDRLSELRELIPNGEKMSIDRLLERTIRHLNFMQSLTKHAATLNHIDTQKSVDVIKNGSSKAGVTWACEVGDQNMICPLIVEDLSTPGQMLIEMLCEEQGLFLEIVDIIRGFGLSIRKGVMEIRETKKIWAHFMVEAEGNRHVSRHEIFSSLIQLLQMTGQSASHDHGNVMASAMPAFNNFEAFPINFPDALQCNDL